MMTLRAGVEKVKRDGVGMRLGGGIMFFSLTFLSRG
jgi:hypothetical protein